MAANLTLAELRAEFTSAGGRFLSMPIAGTIAWSAAGIGGVFLPEHRAAIVLMIACIAITPMSLVIARFLGERLVGEANDLGRLMGFTMLTVNLFWAVAVPFWLIEPSSLPLTAGIILGLQWIVLGWIMRHWIGLFHSVVRTLSIVTLWSLFPENRFAIVPPAIAAVYLVSIAVLASRPLPAAAPGRRAGGRGMVPRRCRSAGCPG